MAECYGRLRGYGYDGRLMAPEATRIGQQRLEARAETWEGEVLVEIEGDGSFKVYIGGKGHADYLVCEGGVAPGKVWAAGRSHEV